MVRRRLWSAVAGTLLFASVGLAAPAEASTPGQVGLLNRLGRAVALALDSPTERAWLVSAMNASPFVEHRVPLKRLLATGDGVAPHRAILDRVGLGGRAATTIATLPELELYLAVEAQRLSWHGEAGVDVAVRQPDGSYVIYSADGSLRKVPWNHEPGTRVTLTLAVSEIDYADLESAIRGGARTGDGMLRASQLPGAAVVHPMVPCRPEDCPPPPPPPPPGGITTFSTQLNTIQLRNDHEGAFGGLNEIEIFGNINGFFQDCGRVSNIGVGPVYVVPAFFANTTLAWGVPDPTHTFKMEAFEDDSGACVRNGSDDPVGSWTTRGVFRTEYGMKFGTEGVGDLNMSVRETVPFE